MLYGGLELPRAAVYGVRLVVKREALDLKRDSDGHGLPNP